MLQRPTPGMQQILILRLLGSLPCALREVAGLVLECCTSSLRMWTVLDTYASAALGYPPWPHTEDYCLRCSLLQSLSYQHKWDGSVPLPHEKFQDCPS